MITSQIRKLGSLMALGLVVGLTSVASAAENKLIAHLDPTRIDANADGRALWTASRTEMQFSVGVTNEDAEHEALWVLINGKPIGRMNIDRKGNGSLQITLRPERAGSADFPRVTVGSSVAVMSAEGDMILYGRFRADH